MELKSELEDLEQKENMLDQQKFWVEQSIKNTTEDCSKYPLSKKTMQRVQESLKCFTFPSLTITFKLKMRCWTAFSADLMWFIPL